MVSLKGISFLIRSTGIGQILRILLYTLQRERLNRRYIRENKRRNKGPAVPPGNIQSTETTPNGAIFYFEGADLKIDFLTKDLARISWEPGTPPIPYAIAKTDWGRVEVTLREDGDRLRLSSEALQILVDNSGGLKIFNPEGRLIHHALAPLRLGPSTESSWISRSTLRPEEFLLGLGEQAGPLNLRGSIHRMWNMDPGGSYSLNKDPLYMPMPVYMGLHLDGSYLVFFENSYPATLDFGQTTRGSSNISQVHFEGGMLRYYFISGNPERLLQRYTQVTGRPEIPPLWSLGYHQSRWGYQSQAEILKVVQGFVDHQMPLSAIHLDIDYKRGYRVFTVDLDRFPDLALLSRELDQQDVKLVVIINPGVKVDPNYFIYREGEEGNHFCKLPGGEIATGVVWPGKSAYPDFTDPNTRNWWGDQYKVLLEAGVSGFWHDMNEPTSFAAWGDQSLPLAMQHKMEGDGGDHSQAHNLYAMLMNRAGYEGIRSHRPDKRPWILSRSGWASHQRYAWNWTGDTDSSWESLRMTIATVIGQGLSGLPYTGPDIGGFSGEPSAELYMRWFQLATFLPFFRTHSAIGTPSREPWVYGEPYTSIIRQHLQLRLRLLPYLYTLAWQTSQTGSPLVRPLFWNNPSDQELWNVEDAFLLGEALLIAPILNPGQDKRQIYLPRGTWFDWWSNDIFKGSVKTELATSLEHIPVLVSAGSILPLAETNRLILEIFPPDPQQPSSFQVLYSDHGDGYGDSRLDRFIMTRDRELLEIVWQGEGDYPFPYHQVELQLRGMQAKRSWIDETPSTVQDNRILTGQFRKIRIEDQR